MSLDFEQALQQVIIKSGFHQGLNEVLGWALIPPGKLFRPRLLEALSNDLKVKDSHNILVLGTALELHHAYSLVHDDMPCMDNDDTRRGKLTTHKQFGEWKALLTGDALLAMSYSQLEKLDHPNSRFIRALFHWATGPKGLILGQWIDLGLEAKGRSEAVLRMHELKTARLMQVATIGAITFNEKPTLSSVKAYMRLGSEIGLAFQLLDDLGDLSDAEISTHENEVNPFLIAPELMAQKLEIILNSLSPKLLKLPNTQNFLQAFFKQTAKNLIQNKKHLSSRLPNSFERIEKILTSGVFA